MQYFITNFKKMRRKILRFIDDDRMRSGVGHLIGTLTPREQLILRLRYGLAGEEIIVYKFRTMTVMEDGDQIQQAQKDDERFTKIGRWLRARSLDELPQFLNVILQRRFRGCPGRVGQFLFILATI